LVVEDEWLIAEYLKELLRDEGYEVEGPAASVAEAQLLIEQREPDVAIIDFRLNGETSEPIAKILAGKQIPFVFMSGLAQDDLPEALQVYQSVTKPIDSARLRSLLWELLSPGGDQSEAAFDTAQATFKPHGCCAICSRLKVAFIPGCPGALP
jgi:CheY-like chemotaxis protein